jgi:hypothetical protein
MASDGPTPPAMSEEFDKRKKVVRGLHYLPANATEAWVKKIAAVSGQCVDWYYACGCPQIYTTGSVKKVNKAIDDLLPEYEEAYENYCKNISKTP